MRALECLQSLPDFQHSMCFLSIQSPIARLTTLLEGLIEVIQVFAGSQEVTLLLDFKGLLYRSMLGVFYYNQN